MFDDDEPCPCDDCEMSCDMWDSRYCCSYCQWFHGDSEPDCDDCNPWDI